MRPKMLCVLPLFALAAGPAAAHPLAGAHPHGDGMLAVAAGLALIVTAIGLAMIGARK